MSADKLQILIQNIATGGDNR